MKRIITVVLFLVFALPSFASWRNCMLRIRDSRGRSLSISVDGKRYNNIRKTLSVGNIAPGWHKIKIFSYVSNGYGYREGTLIYQGRIFTKPSMIYYCTVSKNLIDIEENCCIDDYGHWNNNDNWDSWNDSRQEWNNNQQWHNDRDRNNLDDRDYNHTWSIHNDNNDWNNYPNNRPDQVEIRYEDNNWNSYNGTMSTGRFNSLIEQIRSASFESTKINIAKQAVKDNVITVFQLKGILKEFSFESNKLDFIKSSYSKVADKKNIYILYDVFTFQSSKDDLTEFLNRQQSR